MVLVVDDDLAVRISLGLLLKQVGYATCTADGPAGALAAVRAETPAPVLLDTNFSRATTGDDGLALIARNQAAGPAGAGGAHHRLGLHCASRGGYEGRGRGVRHQALA